MRPDCVLPVVRVMFRCTYSHLTPHHCLGPACAALQPTLAELVDCLRLAVHTRQSKNVDVLHLSSQICRRMKGKYCNCLIVVCALRLLILYICFGDWRCVVFGYEMAVHVLHFVSAAFLHIVIPIAEYLSWHAGLPIIHQGYSIIVLPNTAAWSQRQPVCAEAPQDDSGAEGDNKRNAFCLHWDRLVLLRCCKVVKFFHRWRGMSMSNQIVLRRQQ